MSTPDSGSVLSDRNLDCPTMFWTLPMESVAEDFTI